MRALCWTLLTMAAIATGAGGWVAWHYQSVVIAMVALHGCWVTYRSLLAVIESHKLTCAACKRWQPALLASGCCERCFWDNFQGAKK